MVQISNSIIIGIWLVSDLLKECFRGWTANELPLTLTKTKGWLGRVEDSRRFHDNPFHIKEKTKHFVSIFAQRCQQLSQLKYFSRSPPQSILFLTLFLDCEVALCSNSRPQDPWHLSPSGTGHVYGLWHPSTILHSHCRQECFWDILICWGSTMFKSAERQPWRRAEGSSSIGVFAFWLLGLLLGPMEFVQHWKTSHVHSI